MNNAFQQALAATHPAQMQPILVHPALFHHVSAFHQALLGTMGLGPQQALEQPFVPLPGQAYQEQFPDTRGEAYQHLQDARWDKVGL